jgi:hypothetical protein
MLCAEHTIGSEIVMEAPDDVLCDLFMWNLIWGHLEIVLVLVQDWCVCVKHTIGSEIILDTSNDTRR